MIPRTLPEALITASIVLFALSVTLTLSIDGEAGMIPAIPGFVLYWAGILVYRHRENHPRHTRSTR